MTRHNLSTRFAELADLEFVQQDHYLPTETVRRKIEAREVIVAESDGKLVGYLRFEYLWSRAPFIALIKVLDEYRRQGAGKAMLQSFEHFAREQGHAGIYSSSQVDEPEAQAWHRHVGFEECGFLGGINRGEIGEVFFRKRL